MHRSRRPCRRRRRASTPFGSIVAFLLLASFGILFAGCGNNSIVKGPDEAPVDDITFTEEDLERFQRLAGIEEEGAADGSGMLLTSQGSAPDLRTAEGTGGALTGAAPVLDLSMVPMYNAIRAGDAEEGKNFYRVTNTFLNVRAEPRVSSALVQRLNGGDMVTLMEFVDAEWAKIQLSGGKTGYAALRYLGRVTTESRLAEEQKAFQSLYYVHFAFVNVRAKPDQKSEKLGQIDGNAFVRPLAIEGDWARVSYQGKEGYVSTGYLSPFKPTFLVRQDVFTLPILRYRADETGVLEAMETHLPRLKQAGVTFLSLRDVEAILVQQESNRNATLPNKALVIAVSGLQRTNIKRASDILYAEGVTATFFLPTTNVGMAGITQKNLMTFIANGFDLQSGGHSGQDLRALTNAQVVLEIAQSRKTLEELTGKKVFAIDYPQGGVNDRVAQVAGEQGYLFGLGNVPEKQFYRAQLLRLPSYTVTSSMTADDVVTLVQ